MDNPKEKFFTLTNNLFTFSNYACNCVTDIENIKPGEVKETVKMQALFDKPLRFAFAPSRGIVRLAKTGAIDSEHILTKLLGIKDGNKEALFSFFSEFGFFFPISGHEYEAVEMESLYKLVRRIKAIVNLMSVIGETRKDYKKILGLTLYLQLSRPVDIVVSCFVEPFSTCQHALFAELNKVSSLPSIGDSMLQQGVEAFAIPDTIFSPSFDLDVGDYSNIIGGFNGAPLGSGQSQMFKDITRLYCGSPNLGDELRKAIDFYFHYQYSIGVIKSYSANGTVEHFDLDENISARYSSTFDDSMKQALIEIAKMVIRDEIGYNLYGMRPQYNTATMSPFWEIQDFLTGIYVSIFFMRPEVELYRKCSNPSCDRLFLVDTTSRKRKYCSSSCRNATSQRTHRYRKQAALEP